ncbi:MAG TPA: L-ribulose-5-phosphate 4-epimerase AraD [Gemmatimonadales bacterium]
MTTKRGTSGSAKLREAVCRANRELAATPGLVQGTFGNVSGVDRAAGLFVIKPSGVPYDQLTPARMVAVALDTGRVLGGKLRPSSDAPTHLEVYRAFNCGGVAHTHSELATAFAQARHAIRCLGTTHADYFRGEVPVTRPLTAAEVAREYERNTGLVIVETFSRGGMSPGDVGAVLVAGHGPFAWGVDASAAVERARALEFVARLAYAAERITPNAPALDAFLVDKHYGRKHGKDAYYGQP